MGMSWYVDFELDNILLSNLSFPSVASFILPENRVELDILCRKKNWQTSN
jgi:hypothetical protein